MADIVPARRPRQPTSGVGGGPRPTAANYAQWTIIDVPANETPLVRTSQSAEASQQTVAGENSLVRVVYGERRIGGQIVGVLKNSLGYLVLVVVWCEGPISAVTSLEINDAPLPADGSVTAYHFLGTTPAANYTGTDLTWYDTLKTYLTQQTPPITTFNDQFDGVAWSMVLVRPPAAGTSSAVSGFPRPSATIQGKLVARPSQAYVALDGVNDVATAPDSTAIRVDEDFTLEVGALLADWTPAAAVVLVNKWGATGFFSWKLQVNATTGTLSLMVSTNGTAFNTYTSSAAPAFTNGVIGWVRVAFDKTNGTNSTATFYTSADGITWATLGTMQTSTVVASVYSGGATAVRIGQDGAGFYAQTVWYAKLSTPTKVAFEFLPWEAPAGATTITSGNGELWTLTGAVVNAAMVAYSRNPTAVLADFARSTRYGEGKRVDLRHAMRCEALNDQTVSGVGGSQVRHQIDLVLDTSQETLTWRNVLRDYAHCWVTDENGVLYFVRDANDGVAMSFTDANIVEGSFAIKTKSPRSKPTVIEVTWTDTSTTVHRDAKYIERFPGVLSGTVPRRASARSKPGISRYAEAVRYAIEELNAATLVDSIIQFQAFDDALVLRVGNLVNVSHTAVGYVAKPFRVKKIASQSAGRYTIVADEFDPALYSNDVVTSPTVLETNLPIATSPPSISGLAMAEEYFQVASHQKWLTRMRATWTEPVWSFAFDYAVRLIAIDPSGGESIYYDGIKGDTVFISPEVQEGNSYRIEVAVRGPYSRGATATATASARGNALPPSDVTGLIGSEAGGRVFLRWDAAADRGTLRYEIRYGTTAVTWDTAALIDRVDALAYLTPGFPSGVTRFFVKAFDSLGLYSSGATYTDVVILTDDSSFKALTFTPTSWQTIAVSQFRRDGVTFGVTDFGDPVNYGHTTAGDATAGGDFDDATTPSSTPLALPHSNALRFNGSNTYVAIPNAAGLNAGTTFSLDVWVYLELLPAAASAYCIYSNTNTSGVAVADEWALLVNDAGVVYISNIITVNIAQNSTALAVGTWNHIAVTYNAAGTSWVIYINGSAASSSVLTATAIAADTANQKTLGRTDKTSGAFYFRGIIADVRWWNSVLTAAEVLSVMQYRGLDAPNVINAGGITLLNLLGAWPARDSPQASSSTLVDDLRNVSNGTINGSFEWRSWDQVVSNIIDMGGIYSASFEVSHQPTAISGAVRTTIFVSSDGITYYEQPAGPATARYVRIKQQSEGGAALYDLTNTNIRVNLTPRSEYNIVTTSATASVPVVVKLAGSYSSALKVLLTAKLYNALPATPVYDQIEVSGGRGLLAGRSLRFNNLTGSANGCYVTVGDHAQFEFHNATNDLAFSIECWVKFDTVTAVQTFIGKGTGLPSGEYQLRIKADGKFALILVDSTTGDMITIATTLAFQPKVWYHVAATYTGSAPTTGGVKIYVMGKEEPTTITSLLGTYVRMRDSTEKLIIGNQDNAGTFNSPLNGVIDEVRVWNVVRTVTQIADNMSDYVASNATGLVGYWKFDETTGLTAADSQTNTTVRNGTLGNAGTFNGALIGAGGVSTDKWWRPYDGFDVYCFNNVGTAQIANEVQTEFIGA